MTVIKIQRITILVKKFILVINNLIIILFACYNLYYIFF